MMKFPLKYTLLIVCGVCALCLIAFAGFNKKSSIPSDDLNFYILDAIYSINGGHFDQKFYAKINKCAELVKASFKEITNAQWNGYIEYSKYGNGKDSWGCRPTGNKEMATSQLQIYDNEIIVHEPCNLISNVAFLHTASEVCSRKEDLKGKKFSIPENKLTYIIKGLFQLSFGSSFHHSSNTLLGQKMDNISISALGYTIQQTIMEQFADNVILYELTTVKRENSAEEMMDKLEKMYVNMPVSKWFEHINALNLPARDLPVVATAIFVLRATFSPFIFDMAANPFVKFFNLGPEDTKFMLRRYIPEIKRVWNKKVHLDEKLVIKIVNKMIKAFLKGGFINTESRDDVKSIMKTASAMFANKASKNIEYQYYDEAFQSKTNLYPGQKECDVQSPHSKWHIESALCILDVIYLADDLYNLVKDNS